MTFSDTAIRRNIPNEPTMEEVVNLTNLCCHILQPVREHFGKAVRINSGFRSVKLCEAVGSSGKSQHAKGQAADFEIFGVSNKELADWIHYNINYDQLILEYWKEEDPNSGWVHCSYNEGNNRREYLKAYKENGSTKYEKIF